MTDFGPLLRALAQVEADLKANAPLPPPTGNMTSAEALAAVTAVQGSVFAVSAWLVAHPGVYWAARRVLTALAAMRVPWAVQALAGLKAAPGALATAAIWLPRIVGLLSAIQPAPGGLPGMRPSR